jgi:peptide/nickel transport system permease protein
VFIETLFQYPGMGRLIFEAVAARDYPVIQGVFLVVALVVLTANLLADGLNARLDPRLVEEVGR